MGESIQKRLGRVRPPRVQITYDVEVGDAIVKKELPFVMGIMADLAGDRTVREIWGFRRWPSTSCVLLPPSTGTILTTS